MTGTQDGLAARATRAAHRARQTDPNGFACRHQDWHTWATRARLGRTLATLLGIGIEQISITDDPDRTYGPVPGTLLTVTDPTTGHPWRFVPDLTSAESFLLLGECPDCAATVPITRIATLADLGAWTDTEDPDYDPTAGLPDEFDADPAHHPECAFAD